MTSEDEAVKLMVELLALKCGYSPKEAEQIKTASVLHDIGKIKIPKGLINKPGKLSHEEFEIMKMHTKYGEQLLFSIQGELGKKARQIALLHHEKYNGCGYWGYKSSDLPLYTSIVSVCDVAVRCFSRGATSHHERLMKRFNILTHKPENSFAPN